MQNNFRNALLLFLCGVTIGICALFALAMPWTQASPADTAPAPAASSTTPPTLSLGGDTAGPQAPPTDSGAPEAAIMPTPPADSGARALGIAGGGVLSKLSASELNSQLDSMVALGATWVRFDIEWGNVQYSSPQSSTWQSYDALAKAIAAHGLHGLGIILFTPQWARDPSCTGGAKCPPKNPSDYATFAAQVAARYSAYGIHAWEIWNEPNSYDFWATQTDCAAYTALLKAAYPAIKKADPGSTVITGGLAPLVTDNHNISQTDFLTCIYANGGRGYFDAVGDHPYTYPNLPLSGSSDAWARMSLTSPSLRSIMIANKDADKKIWITEYGAPTNGPDPHWYMSEAKEAEMAQSTLALYRGYSWAGPLFWYTIKDGSTATTSNENFFGLLRADGSAKPAYDALKKMITEGL